QAKCDIRLGNRGPSEFQFPIFDFWFLAKLGLLALLRATDDAGDVSLLVALWFFQESVVVSSGWYFRLVLTEIDNLLRFDRCVLPRLFDLLEADRLRGFERHGLDLWLLLLPYLWRWCCPLTAATRCWLR